jgi:hypothetical protein
MNATSLIEQLASLERNLSRTDQTEIRTFVIDAQDCILRMQEEILQLRRMNVSLQGMIETLNLGHTREMFQRLDIAPSTHFAA